jgi:hypothetical protein
VNRLAEGIGHSDLRTAARVLGELSRRLEAAGEESGADHQAESGTGGKR